MAVSGVEHRLEDPALPPVGVLLGPSASEVVGEALAQEGATVQSLTADHVSYRPGRRIVVAYEADLEWRDGTVTVETVVAYARPHDPPSGTVPVRVGDMTVGVWRLPHDPSLPGLETAQDSAFVRGVLDDLGAPGGPISVERRAYWPRSRAVVEVTTATSNQKVVFRPGEGVTHAPPVRLLYLKVMRLDESGDVYRRHQLLAEHLPVPRCYGHIEESGILLLEARAGRTLYDCVQDGVRPVPEGPELLELLDLLGGIEVGGERNETTGEVAHRYAPMLKAVVPREAERIDRFLERLGEEADQPLVTTHGDFHEYQLLVDQGRITGLLDVDDVGPGHLIDDLASMAGRFWSFAVAETQGRDRLERYTHDLLRAFGGVVDPEELHRRVAAVLFARATSPFRSQETGWPGEVSRAIGLAEEWLARPVVSA